MIPIKRKNSIDQFGWRRKHAYSRKIRTESEKEYFIKSYHGTDSSILRNEANVLSELRKTNAIAFQIMKISQ